jgi:hydrogenase-4 component F
MFAYSGIEHMGIVMLGIAAGGIGYYAAILHIILHAFVKSSLFFQFNQLYRTFQSKSIQYVGNYFKYNPTGAIVLLIGFISATAMPPSGLFVSEFLIFRSLFEGQVYYSSDSSFNPVNYCNMGIREEYSENSFYPGSWY